MRPRPSFRISVVSSPRAASARARTSTSIPDDDLLLAKNGAKLQIDDGQFVVCGGHYPGREEHRSQPLLGTAISHTPRPPLPEQAPASTHHRALQYCIVNRGERLVTAFAPRPGPAGRGGTAGASTMRVQTYQIRWHWPAEGGMALPMFSADFHSLVHTLPATRGTDGSTLNGDGWRLATGGADHTVKVGALADRIGHGRLDGRGCHHSPWLMSLDHPDPFSRSGTRREKRVAKPKLSTLRSSRAISQR